MDDRILYTQNLSVGYGKKTILEDVNLDINKGEIISIIGPNGSGKSTLIKTLCGFIKPIKGEVYINSKNLHTYRKDELSKVMSVVLTGRVDPELILVRDVVAMGRYPYTGKMGILGKNDYEVIERVIEETGIKDIVDCEFDKISDGQKQKVLLARAFAQEPQILIMDEPTSFLDINHRLELLNLLKNQVDSKNISVIMSIHELELTRKISDKILCVNSNGKTEIFSDPEEVFKEGHIEGLFNISKETLWLK